MFHAFVLVEFEMKVVEHQDAKSYAKEVFHIWLLMFL
jgi:hypothetical protein